MLASGSDMCTLTIPNFSDSKQFAVIRSYGHCSFHAYRSQLYHKDKLKQRMAVITILTKKFA